MVVSSLKPHVPPEASPEVVIPLLKELTIRKASFSSVKALRQLSESVGLSARPEIPVFLSSIGLLASNSGNEVEASNLAYELLQVEEKALIDILHYLIYSRWTEQKPHQSSDSWGYRRVSQIYWDRAPVDVLEITDYITEEIRNRALLQFDADVSFSPKSIRGVRKWLEALSPPVVKGRLFERRNFVHPPLLLVATGWVAQNSGGEIGIDMLLTPERREAICRVCLLDPSALDQTLDWMLPVYPGIVGPGTSSGTYGRFVQFHKWPTLADLAA